MNISGFMLVFRGVFKETGRGEKNDPSLLGVVSEFLFFFQIL